jgi:glycosyltransferase involved in cell wall biosynthesis
MESVSERMKVSIVIPTYNRGYIIREAVASALAQEYTDFEVIVVDDGSSDNTREIIEQFKNEKILYLRHERNRGCSAAYNTGITASTGQLIAFLDSDDVWKPSYLEKLVTFLGKNAEVDVVFCDTEIHSDSTDIPSLIALLPAFSRLVRGSSGAGEYVFTGRQMFVCMLEEIPIKPSAAVIRKEMFDKAGNFNEEWPSGTDWDLFLRFSHMGNFGYIDLPLAIQRRTPDATHQKFLEKDKLFLLGVLSKEKTKLDGDREALLAVNRGISGCCRNLAFGYLHAGQRRKSMAVCLQGFKETGEAMMLVRAASALVPAGVRSMVKGAVRRSPSTNPVG